MNERLEAMKARVRDRDHARFRQDTAVELDNDRYEHEGLSWHRRMSDSFRLTLEAERPLILDGERIVFTRTLRSIPQPLEPAEVRAERERGKRIIGVSNVSCDWGPTVAEGLLSRRATAAASLERLAVDPEAVEAMTSCIETIDAALDLTRRYAEEAARLGRDDLVEILDHVPAYAPRTFHEALQSFKLLHAITWLQPTQHVSIGRFDQYMLPYYEADIAAGRITEEKAYELLCELFISMNKDSDLYTGVQRGDNGQSLVLGGVKPRDGSCAVNALTRLCLRVSHDVNMIDPKINLRLTKDTDLELLTEAAKLTRRGLGFPQYANDDVVIQSLVNAGYALEDARDYAVAACWEFIVPGVGADVPNIHAMSFLAAADTAIREGLAAGDGFDGLMARARAHIFAQVESYVANWRQHTLYMPYPWYTVLMRNCVSSGLDANRGGAKYYNCGIHGAGSANGADALAAVKKLVFEERSVEPRDLLAGLESDFENAEALRARLLTECPKVGNNDDEADAIMVRLFEDFADACESQRGKAGRYAIVRAGTGSAMYYVWLVRGDSERMLEPVVSGATADGRRKGDFIGSSLAPSPGVRVRGPISVLQSFAKINYARVCNGGPITMELADSVFRDEDAIRKVALLIRTFAEEGGQQLQLNALNVETLRDAKRHPERHKNLIVRVWGWSGYFCELDEPYQDHIIGRHMLTV